MPFTPTSLVAVAGQQVLHVQRALELELRRWVLTSHGLSQGPVHGTVGERRQLIHVDPLDGQVLLGRQR